MEAWPEDSDELPDCFAGDAALRSLEFAHLERTIPVAGNTAALSFEEVLAETHGIGYGDASAESSSVYDDVVGWMVAGPKAP